MFHQILLLMLSYAPLCALHSLYGHLVDTDMDKMDSKKSSVTAFPEYLLYDRHMIDLQTLFDFIEKAKQQKKSKKNSLTQINDLSRFSGNFPKAHTPGSASVTPWKIQTPTVATVTPWKIQAPSSTTTTPWNRQAPSATVMKPLKRQAPRSTAVKRSLRSESIPTCSSRSVALELYNVEHKKNINGQEPTDCKEIEVINITNCTRYRLDEVSSTLSVTCSVVLPAVQTLISAKLMLKLTSGAHTRFTAILTPSINSEQISYKDGIVLDDATDYCYERSMTNWMKRMLNGVHEPTTMTVKFEARCGSRLNYGCLTASLEKPFIVVDLLTPKPSGQATCNHNFHGVTIPSKTEKFIFGNEESK